MESLRLEYQNALAAQQLPPFTTFFDWLIRYGRLPAFGYGTSPQYDRTTVVATLTNALAFGSSMQLASLGRVMATTVQESTSSSHSSSSAAAWFPVPSSTFATATATTPAMPGAQPNVADMQRRIDKFMTELQKAGFAFHQPPTAPPPSQHYYYQQQPPPQQIYQQHQQSMNNEMQQQQQQQVSSSSYAAAGAANQRELVLESLKDHNRVGQQVSLTDVLNSVQGKQQ